MHGRDARAASDQSSRSVTKRRRTKRTPWRVLCDILPPLTRAPTVSSEALNSIRSGARPFLPPSPRERFREVSLHRARHGGSVLRRAVRRPAPALAVRDPDPDAPRRPRRRCGDTCPAGATSRSPRCHGLCSGEGHRVDQGELNLLTYLLTFDWAYTHYYLGYHGYTHRRSPGKRRRSGQRCAPPRRAGGSLPWTRRPASTTTRPPPKRCGARTLATPAAPACRAPRTVTRPTLRHCPGSIGAHADKLPACR